MHATDISPWSLASLLVGCGLVVACSDVHEPGSGAQPATPYVLARCAYEARCDPQRLQLYRGSSEEGCIELLACISGLQPGQACADAIDAAACEPGALDRALESAACTPPGREPVAEEAEEGGRCDGAGCGAGLVCVSDPSREYCGFCVPGGEVGAGDACSAAWRCDDQTFCDADGICRERQAEGAPCENQWQCLSQECSDEGVCYRPATGDPCSEYFDCPPAHVCRSGRCLAAPDFGQACDVAEQVLVLDGISGGGGCKATMACVEGRCVEARCGGGPVDLGEPCGAGTRCPEGAVCDRQEARCRPLPAKGERCKPEFLQWYGMACRAGAYCDDDTLRCTPQRARGEACDAPSQCIEGECDPEIGTCEPYSPPAMCTDA